MGRPRKGEERHGTGILNIKGISPQARDVVLHPSRVRGLTMARYMERLVKLHQRCRSLADGGDTRMQAMLEELEIKLEALERRLCETPVRGANGPPPTVAR